MRERLEVEGREGKRWSEFIQVKSFFSRIDEENNGQLDILVNNAYAAVNVSLLPS